MNENEEIRCKKVMLQALDEKHPATIGDLVGIVKETTKQDEKIIIRVVGSLIRQDIIQVNGKLPEKPALLYNLIKRIPILGKDVPLLREPQIRAFMIILFFSVISWFLVLPLGDNPFLLPARLAFVGPDLCFMPGFALMLAWYPLSSKTLDFSLLNKASMNNDEIENEHIGIFGMVSYSICFSVGLLVLFGILIPIDLVVMLSILTIIKGFCFFHSLRLIFKIKDPYREI